MTRRWMMIVSVLLAGSLAACSSSKSAESDESGQQEATAEANDGDEGAESDDDSEMTYHERMQKLHSELVERYRNHADIYAEPVEKDGPEEVVQAYRELRTFHEHESKMYRKKEKREAKEKDEGAKKEKKHEPKPKHVAKMAEKMHKVAERHGQLATWAEDEASKEVREHHVAMAEDYEKLANMHDEFASRLREKEDSGASDSGEESS